MNLISLYGNYFETCALTIKNDVKHYKWKFIKKKNVIC